MFAVGKFFPTIHWLFLFSYVGPNPSKMFIVLIPRIALVIGLKDGFFWALRNAHSAINAFIWIDYQHVFTLVKTVHRAHTDTGGVLAVNAFVIHYMRHSIISITTIIMPTINITVIKLNL